MEYTLPNNVPPSVPPIPVSKLPFKFISPITSNATVGLELLIPTRLLYRPNKSNHHN